MPKFYDPDEETEIILCAIKGEKISNFADEYSVGHNSIYLWENEFLDGGMSKLIGESVTVQEAKLEEKDELTGPNQLWEMDMVQIYIDNSDQWVYIFDYY